MNRTRLLNNMTPGAKRGELGTAIDLMENRIDKVATKAKADIAMIGDSRIVGVYNDYVLSPTSPTGVPPVTGQYVQLLGTMGDVLPSETGTYQYDHATGKHRWQAGSDEYGAWKDAHVGRHLLESGVIGRGMRLLIWRALTQSFEIAVTMGSVRQYYYGGWLLNRHGLAPGVESAFRGAGFHRLGAGGCRTLDALNMLPYYNRQAPQAGVDVWWCGTNDISNNVPAKNMAASARAIFDARRSRGRKIVILGEHARWGVDTSTPLTSGQRDIHAAYNDALQEYAAVHPNDCRFIDTLSSTADVAHSDLRPQLGVTGAFDMLYDTVHPWLGASLAILPPVIEAINDFMGAYKPQPIDRRDSSIIDFVGTSWFPGADGTVSGSVASTTGVPTNITVEQTANVTASWNKAAFKSEPGVALECEYTSTPAASQYTRARATSLGTYSLAALGLAVGDFFEFESLIEIDSCNVDDKFRIYATFSNSTTTTIAEMVAPSAPGVYRLKTAQGQIPSGTTAVLFRLEIWTDTANNSSGKCRFGKFVARKLQG